MALGIIRETHTTITENAHAAVTQGAGAAPWSRAPTRGPAPIAETRTLSLRETSHGGVLPMGVSGPRSAGLMRAVRARRKTPAATPGPATRPISGQSQPLSAPPAQSTVSDRASQ